MARIRTIKPEFFRHEGLQDLEAANPGAHVMLVFAGLWGHCDKAGRFEWRPRTLKLDILPFLSFDMAATLAILCEAGQVRRYAVDGREYGEIASFAAHQRLSGKEAQEPEKHPAPPEKRQGSNGEATGKQSPAQEGKGREEEGNRKGREEEGSTANASPGTRTGQLCKQLRGIGIDAAPHQFAHPDWQSLLSRFDDEAILGAAEMAKARKPNDRLGINYLVPILNEPPKPPPTAGPSNGRRYASSGRQAAIDNYAAQAAAARGEQSDGPTTGERDITGEATRVA